jgi:hypothetical protein
MFKYQSTMIEYQIYFGVNYLQRYGKIAGVPKEVPP